MLWKHNSLEVVQGKSALIVGVSVILNMLDIADNGAGVQNLLHCGKTN